MAEEKKNNWANWDIKEQPKIELEDIPEEPKKERTAAEREEEVSNLRAKIARNTYWELEENKSQAILNSPDIKGAKVYGRFRSYLMDNKGKIILYLLSFFFLGVTIALLVASSLTSSDLGMPTWLLTFIGMASLTAGFGLLFFAVESD